MANVWRLNIKTDASESVDPRKFSITRDVLGVGWPVDSAVEITWENYCKLGEDGYYNKGDKGWWPAVNALKNRMQVNDLCWTAEVDWE